MLAMRHLYSARFPEAGIRAHNKRDRTNRRDTSKDKELGGRYLGGQGAVEDSPYTSTPCVPAPWLRPSAILVAVSPSGDSLITRSRTRADGVYAQTRWQTPRIVDGPNRAHRDGIIYMDRTVLRACLRVLVSLHDGTRAKACDVDLVKGGALREECDLDLDDLARNVARRAMGEMPTSA